MCVEKTQPEGPESRGWAPPAAAVALMAQLAVPRADVQGGPGAFPMCHHMPRLCCTSAVAGQRLWREPGDTGPRDLLWWAQGQCWPGEAMEVLVVFMAMGLRLERGLVVRTCGCGKETGFLLHGLSCFNMEIKVRITQGTTCPFDLAFAAQSCIGEAFSLFPPAASSCNG